MSSTTTNAKRRWEGEGFEDLDAAIAVAKIVANANPATPPIDRRDPSRTAALRKQFAADAKRRLSRLALDITRTIVAQDAFGLDPLIPDTFPSRAWVSLQRPEQVQQFQLWLSAKLDEHLLSQAWWLPYIEQAYLRGVGRSYSESYPKPADSRDDFIRRVLLKGRAALVANMFCPTGPGGGINPTCGKGGKGVPSTQPERGALHERVGAAAEKHEKNMRALVTQVSAGKITAADGTAKAREYRDKADGAVRSAFLASYAEIRDTAVTRFGDGITKSPQWAALRDAYREGTDKAYYSTAAMASIVSAAAPGSAKQPLYKSIAAGKAGVISSAHQTMDKVFSLFMAMAGSPPTVNVTNARRTLRDYAGRFISERVRLLSLRLESELKSVTTEMSQRIARQLLDGLDRGYKPSTIARSIVNTVDGIGKQRAILIAQTETVRAHAEGQLDAMEELGVQQIKAAVEWDVGNAPCELCAPMDGVVLSPQEARGMIPRHPRCKCSWKHVYTKGPKQILQRAKINKAVATSQRREGNDSDFGPAVDVSRRRPLTNRQALIILNNFLMGIRNGNG